MLAFRAQGLTPEEVERIDLEVHEHVMRATSKRELRTELDSKFSVFHCVAVALVDGEVSVRQFTRPRIDDPIVAALRPRVFATLAPDLARDQTRVAVTLRDGRRRTLAIEHATGTELNPMTDEQVVKKYHGLVDPILGSERAERLADSVWTLEEMADLGSLSDLAAG